MRNLLPFLLCAGLAAQVPDGYVLVTHQVLNGNLASAALTMLEPATGVATPIRTTGKLTTLARGFVVNPSDGTQLWCNPGLAQIGTISAQKATLQGSYLVATQLYSITGAQGSGARYWIIGPDLYIAIGGAAATAGVYKVQMGTTTATQVVTLPRANAMTSIGTKLYVADYGVGVPSTIVELDVVTSQQRTVGTSYVALRGLTTFGGQLLAGNDAGDLVTISPTTGAASTLFATGQGAIVAVVADGSVGLPVFATANKQVFRYPLVNTPLWTSSGGISELSAGRAPMAAALSFGASCKGTPTAAATFAFTAYPVIPSPAFQLSLTNLKATTPGALLLGTSRTSLSGLPLPFDLTAINMAGCWLYQDLVITSGFVSDAAGQGLLALPIPNLAGLAGAHVVAQAYVADAATNPLGISTEGYELILH